MDRIFVKSLIDNLNAESSLNLPGFSLKEIHRSSSNRKDNDIVALLTMSSKSPKAFISFRSQKNKDSQIFVELGWFHGNSIPTHDKNSLDLLEKIQGGNRLFLDADFSVRLFFLCPERGKFERAWDFYCKEKWDAARESYAQFSQRAGFSIIDEKIRIKSEGGPSPEYASEQAKNIMSDIYDCLSNHGIPFLKSTIFAIE